MNNKIISALRKMVLKRSSLQVLLYMKLENNKLIYTNLDDEIIIDVGVDSELKGIIDPKLFFETKDFEKSLVTNIKFEDYPLLKSTDPNSEKIMLGIDFRNIDFSYYKNIVSHASYEALSGMYFHPSKICCTNGHILVNQRIEGITTDFILPDRVFDIIDKLKTLIKTSYVCGNHLCLVGEDFEFRTKLIEEKYPDYEKVIPDRKNKSSAWLKKDKIKIILESLKVLKPYISKESRNIIFDKNIIKTINTEKQIVYYVKLDFEVFDLETVGFNFLYLYSFLKIFEETETLTIFYDREMGATRRFFTDFNGDKKVLIMPFKIEKLLDWSSENKYEEKELFIEKEFTTIDNYL